MAKAIGVNMNYYEKLVKQIDKSVRAHPRSTVVMDSGTFEILASGANPKQVSRKLSTTKAGSGISVVFQRPSETAVWILARV